MLKYCSLALSTAFRHSLDITQTILFVALILVGGITALVPSVTFMIDIGAWQVAAITLGAIVGVRLVLAPYWIWKGDQNKIETLEGGFDDDVRKTIDTKLRALSEDTINQLYRLADGTIGLHQLVGAAESELGAAALLVPRYANDPLKFTDHWPLIKQWLKKNQQ